MALYPTGVKYRGLNRAGAEYGDEWDGWNGQTFYDVPPKRTLAAELNHYAVKGFNTLRLPISWERLQHNLNGPLDAGYQKQITSFVTQANSDGWTVIIDLHNYNRYATGAFDAAGNQVGSYTQETMGKGVLTIAHLTDVWTKLANLFNPKPKVIFNLMNEPHDFPIDSDDWFAQIQTLMDAIR